MRSTNKNVVSSEDSATVLQRLGLTLVQARTYLALHETGSATADTIAKTAHIARQHIYEPLQALEKMGLVQRTLGSPPIYKMVPVQEAVNILMENRNRESCELRDQANVLIEKLQKDPMTIISNEQEHTAFLKGIEAFTNKADKALKNAQICFNGTASVELFRHGMFFSGVYHRRALKNGVRYRHIISKPEKQAVQLGDEDLGDNPLWKVRFSPWPLHFQMTIIDNKEVFISTKPQLTKECTYYWSTNKCFLILAQNYFESLWNQSTPRVAKNFKKHKDDDSRTPKKLKAGPPG